MVKQADPAEPWLLLNVAALVRAFIFLGSSSGTGFSSLRSLLLLRLGLFSMAGWPMLARRL